MDSWRVTGFTCQSPTPFLLLKRLKKGTAPILVLKGFFCEKQFWSPIIGKMQSYHMLVRLWRPFYHIVNYSKGRVLHKGECIVFSLKANVSSMSLKKLFFRRFVPSEGHSLISYSPTVNVRESLNMPPCILHFLCNHGQKWGRKIDFTHRILDLSLIFLATFKLPKGIYETLNHNRKKDEISLMWFVSSGENHEEIFSIHVLKTVS